MRKRLLILPAFDIDNVKQLLEDLLKGKPDRVEYYLNEIKECRTAKDVAYRLFLPLVSKDGLDQKLVRLGKLPKAIAAAVNAYNRQHPPSYKPITPKNRSFQCIQALTEWEKEQAEKAKKEAEETLKKEAEEKEKMETDRQANSKTLSDNLMMLIDPENSEHPENIDLFMKIMQSSAHKLGISVSQYQIHSSGGEAITEKRISDRHTTKRSDDRNFDIAQGFHPAGTRSQSHHWRLYTDTWGHSRLALSA